MNSTTINAIHLNWETIWHYIIGACALSAALLSLSFILAIIGGALWQTVTDACRRLRRIANFPALSGIKEMAFQKGMKTRPTPR